VLSRDDTELVWVDNGSEDGAGDYVALNYPGATRVTLPGNLGVACGRNAGIRRARGRYILLLDDDTEATPEAIDAMLRYAEDNPRAGVTACALRDPYGNLQDSFKPYPGLLQKVRNVIAAKLHRARHVSQPDGIIRPAYVIGACQLLSRKMLDEIGLLDEKIFYGPEDADLCLRAAAAGWQVTYLPAPSILHHWRRITTGRLTTPSARRHIRALLYFWRKHHRLL